MSRALDLAISYSKPEVDANLKVYTPTGSVAMYPVATIPTGWLKANGAAISRTTYSALFAAIGTTYGAGDGSTTFNLPDLRGEFIRGFDDGRGVDSGRVFGSLQYDQMQRITGIQDLTAARFVGGTSAGALSQQSVGSSGASSTSAGTRIIFDSANSPNARTSETTGGETRPRNVALLACIKY